MRDRIRFCTVFIFVRGDFNGFGRRFFSPAAPHVFEESGHRLPDNFTHIFQLIADGFLDMGEIKLVTEPLFEVSRNLMAGEANLSKRGRGLQRFKQPFGCSLQFGKVTEHVIELQCAPLMALIRIDDL